MFSCLAACVLLAWGLAVGQMYSDITAPSSREPICPGEHPTDAAAQKACAQEMVDRFFKIDYSESKDLAKSFLTLLVAVFVASVTFSEKIIGIGAASGLAKVSMLACWILLLIAIVACGIGLTYIMFALGDIVYVKAWPYEKELRAGWLFAIAGVAFVLSLCALLLSGIQALFLPSTSETPASPIPRT